jgi:hypothetical protein
MCHSRPVCAVSRGTVLGCERTCDRGGILTCALYGCLSRFVARQCDQLSGSVAVTDPQVLANLAAKARDLL